MMLLSVLCTYPSRQGSLLALFMQRSVARAAACSREGRGVDERIVFDGPGDHRTNLGISAEVPESYLLEVYVQVM